jgi:phage gp16-like protein
MGGLALKDKYRKGGIMKGIKPIDSQDTRRRDLALIHIAKKQLGLNDGCYREILFNVTGLKSSALLDMEGRAKLLAHFKKIGFTPVHPSAKGSGMNVSPSQDREPFLLKIEALLSDLGLPWAYTDGMAKRMFGVDRVRWLPPDQLQKVMVALIYFQKRRRA